MLTRHLIISWLLWVNSGETLRLPQPALIAAGEDVPVGTGTVPIKFNKDKAVCDSELGGHLLSYRHVA